jgi:hypothetical protein
MYKWEKWDVSKQMMVKLENLTCLIYVSKLGTMNVNDLIYHLFCETKGSWRATSCLHANIPKHAQRANYQAAVRKRSLQKRSPIERGWHWYIQDCHMKLAVDWTIGYYTILAIKVV